VLLSGHHAQIAQWRRSQALALTARQRPDMIERARSAGQLSALDEMQLSEKQSSEKQLNQRQLEHR
jgi:tRNA (guanine37-N1)-methyltransferase